MDWLVNWSVLLVFGTIGFWVATVVVVTIIAPCVIFDRKKYTGRIATIALLAYLTALALMGGPNVFKLALHYWYLVPVVVVVHFFAGRYYAIYVQWKLRLSELSGRLEEEIRKFLRERKIEGDAIPADLAEEWQRHLSRVDPPIDIEPDPDNYKYDIYFWIGFWPLSAAWTLLRDPLTRAVKHLYRISYQQMKKMSADEFAKAKQNLPPAPPSPPAGSSKNGPEPSGGRPYDPDNLVQKKPRRPADTGSGEFVISR